MVKVMRTVFIMFIILLGITGCSDTSQPAKEDNPQMITSAEFEKLDKGISYDKAQDIIGGEGKRYSDKDQTAGPVVYGWNSKNGDMALITFINDKLAVKEMKSPE